MEIREYFLSFSLYSQVHSFQLCRWRIRLSREEVSLARESRMTLSLRWMCMQRTTFHRPVFFLSLSLSFIFSLVSLRVFLVFFFFLTFRASIELERTSSVRRFSQRRRGKFVIIVSIESFEFLISRNVPLKNPRTEEGRLVSCQHRVTM